MSDTLLTDDEMCTPSVTMESLLGPDRFARPRHVEIMSNKIAECMVRPIRLIVQVSVRHGKSWVGSLATPVWYLAANAENSVALATYQANFAARWGRRVRNTITRYGPSLGVQIAGDSSAAQSWMTTAGGEMHTCGVGGELTGRGFNLMIVDDPIKNAEEAHSELIRENVWDWWTSTAYTRLEPGASVIVIMARWHEDDLAGRLIKQMKEGGEHWDVISLPAIAEEGDAMGRKIGEPLWPERYTTEDLARIKKAVGTYTWSSLYQQRPSPEEGGLFKRHWFRYGEVGDAFHTLHTGLETGDRRVPTDRFMRILVADTAETAKKTADPSVVQVWDVETGQGGPEGRACLLVDQWRDWAEVPVVEQQIVSMGQRWGAIVLGIEKRSSGTGIIQRLRAKGLPVRAIEASVDKVTRSVPAQVATENGRVYFNKSLMGLAELESELLTFPNAEHDDQVDTLAHAITLADSYEAVVSAFDMDANTVAPFELPDDWPLWRGMIAGRETDCVWVAVGYDGTLYVFREYRGVSRTVPDHASSIIAASGAERYASKVMVEPEDWELGRSNAEAIASEYRTAGLDCKPAMKLNRDGEQAVIERLKTMMADRRIKIFASCKRTIAEMRLWQRKADERPEDADSGTVRALLNVVRAKPEYEDPTAESRLDRLHKGDRRGKISPKKIRQARKRANQ